MTTNNEKYSLNLRKIVPNTGSNVTKFFTLANQILKISFQIGD